MSKIRRYPFSFRVIAELNMRNNILTAAKIADKILKQDLKDIIEEKTTHKICIQNAKKRVRRLNKQVSNEKVYFKN